MSRFHPANLRAAWWALRTAWRTRRLLAARGLDAAVAPPPPPALPIEAGRGVRAALRRRRESCLVDSIVLQAWEAAHGRSRDLVVGITGPDDFRAHAWLDGDAVPAPGATEIAISELKPNGSPRWPTAVWRDGSVTSSEDGGQTPYLELLRRPAPRYQLR